METAGKTAYRKISMLFKHDILLKISICYFYENPLYYPAEQRRFFCGNKSGKRISGVSGGEV